MILSSLCICGSGISYHKCCGLYHSGVNQPETAEQLMRARFCAYAKAISEFLLLTWNADQRPDRIDFSESPPTWDRLEILTVKNGQASDMKGQVEFKAYYLHQGDEYVLHEISRFKKESGRWFYVDGKIKANELVKNIPEQHIAKNAPCPCGSGRKFKRCCGTESLNH